jgi:hypothetical protein
MGEKRKDTIDISNDDTQRLRLSDAQVTQLAERLQQFSTFVSSKSKTLEAYSAQTRSGQIVCSGTFDNEVRHPIMIVQNTVQLRCGGKVYTLCMECVKFSTSKPVVHGMIPSWYALKCLYFIHCKRTTHHVHEQIVPIMRCIRDGQTEMLINQLPSDLDRVSHAAYVTFFREPLKRKICNTIFGDVATALNVIGFLEHNPLFVIDPSSLYGFIQFKYELNATEPTYDANMTTEVRLNNINVALANFVKDTHKKIAFPMLFFGHWSLLVVDIETKTVTYYNSIDNSTGDTTEIEKKLLGVNNGLKLAGLITEDLKHVPAASNHQQTDDVSCGLFVLYNLLTVFRPGYKMSSADQAQIPLQIIAMIYFIFTFKQLPFALLANA